MAIIYSYPSVDPTLNDLLLGTDVDARGQPTKNFTVGSIATLVTSLTQGLGATITVSGDAKDKNGANQSAFNFQNVSGSGILTFPTITTGTAQIAGGVGTGFVSIQSTDFSGNLTGIIKITSSIEGTADGAEANNVTAVTQPALTNNKTIATTAYVDGATPTTILSFFGTTGGQQTVNLANQSFLVLGTIGQIESVSSGQTVRFNFPATGVTLPNGSVATTQAAADDSTKIATTAFVRNYDDLQTLNFTDATTASTVLLNSQTLTLEGTANQVTTTVSAQKVKFSLPATVIRNLQGNVTGTILATSSIQGNAGAASTDAENVLAVTQTAGDNSTRIATTAYVDDAAGSKTLSYKDTSATINTMNLADDDIQFTGGSNITSTATAVALNIADIKFDLDDSVTITGTMNADKFETTAQTATWVTTVLDGFTSITSDLFVGDLTGTADFADALTNTGSITISGDVGTTGNVASRTYTSGGNVTLTTSIPDTVVTGKILTGLVVPSAGSSVVPSDTILSGIGKLQAQVNTGATGLRFIGTWNASMDTGGTDATPNGTPALTSGGGIATTGTNTSVNTPIDNKLIDTNATFLTDVTANDRVYNEAGAFTTITSIDSDTELTLVDAIFLTTGQNYSIDNDPALSQGEYYVVSAVGATDSRNATLNSIQNWQVGDWVIAGANNIWERLDQTSIEGAGTTGRVAKFSDTNSIADSIILENSDGIKLDTGKTLTTQGSGGSIVVAGAATISGLTTAGAALSLTGGVTLPVGTYGTVGQVLTNDASPGATTDLIWTTPTTGVVESITGGFGIAVDDTSDPGTAAIPVVSLDYLGTNNAIIKATAYDKAADPIIVAEDEIWFNDKNTNAGTPVLINKIKKAKFSDLPFNNYSWDLNVDGGTASTVGNGNEVDFLSGTGIIQSLSTRDVTTALRYEDENADPSSGDLNFIDATGTAVAPDEDDYLIFSDQFDTATKNVVKRAKIKDIIDLGNETLAEVLGNGNSSGGVKNIDMTGTVSNITLVDSGTSATPVVTQGRLQFGAGNDLSIYHDGTNSFIENVTGDLTISNTLDDITIAAKDEFLVKVKDTEIAIQAVADGKVGLRHNNVEKLVTTSGGVDITGNINANDSLGSTISLARNVVPTVGNNTGRINFQGKNFDSGNLETGASIVGSAEIDWASSVSTTKIIFQTKSGNALSTALEIKGNNDAEFTGNVEIDGNLTVDGSIIHGGGTSGGGTFSGDLDYIADTAATLFDLTRTTTGALIFDVFISMGVSSGGSTVKKFTVAHTFNTDPIFNLVLGSPGASGDSFTVEFTTVTNTTCRCIVTPSGGNASTISYTIMVGNDNSVLTFTPGT